MALALVGNIWMSWEARDRLTVTPGTLCGFAGRTAPLIALINVVPACEATFETCLFPLCASWGRTRSWASTMECWRN